MQFGSEFAPEIRQRQFCIAKSERTADKYAIKLLFHLSVLFFAVCQANATIEVSLQMQLGKPKAQTEPHRVTSDSTLASTSVS
jgi:hypothetical protein